MHMRGRQAAFGRWCGSAAIGLGLMVSLLCLRRADAQVLIQDTRTDTPAVRVVDPPVLTIGKTTTLVLRGERLAKPQALLVEGGVEIVRVVADGEQELQLEVATNETALPGRFPLHLLAAAGLSNPRFIRLERMSTAAEQEPNDHFETAQAVAAPLAIGGRLAARERDVFRFEVPGPVTWVFDLEARRLGIDLFGRLRLADHRGRVVATATADRDGAGGDPRLIHTFHERGFYTIQVDELMFRGADHAEYVLRIGPLPVAATMFPLGGPRDAPPWLCLRGGTIGESVWLGIGEQQQTLGAFTCFAWRQPYSTLAPAQQGERVAAQQPGEGGVQQRDSISRLDGLSWLEAPCRYLPGDGPQHFEAEPNDNPVQAPLCQLPCTLHGVIEQRGDRDAIRFVAKKDEKLRARVFAARLGSQLDGVLRLYDASGRQLATDDDSPQPEPAFARVRGQFVAATTSDPVLDFVIPADGTYTLSVEDNSDRGGACFPYLCALSLTPQPDFELSMQSIRAQAASPTAPQPGAQQNVSGNEYWGQGNGSVSLDRAGREGLLVQVRRREYDGPILLEVEGLPSGVTATGLEIAAGQQSAVIRLAAGFDTPSAASFVRVYGTAEIDGQRLRRPAVHSFVQSSLGSAGAVAMEWSEIALGVANRGAELALLPKVPPYVVAGESYTLEVDVRRREGFRGAVDLKFPRRPTAFVIADQQIAVDAATATIALAVADDAESGPRVLEIEATMPVEGKKEPFAAYDSARIEVRPPLKLELAASQIEVALGGQTEFAVVCERFTRRDGEIEIVADQLPAGVSLAACRFPISATSASLVFTTTPDARTSVIRRVVQLRPVWRSGERVVELPTLRATLRIVAAKGG